MLIAGVDLYVLVTETDAERATGLLNYTQLPEGLGMLITDVTAIHTRGMRFPIDVAWLDETGCVVGFHERLEPEAGASCFGSRNALELAAGFFERHPLTAAG